MFSKRIQCEECCSFNFTIKDSYYVCMDCGAKYIMYDDPRNLYNGACFVDKNNDVIRVFPDMEMCLIPNSYEAYDGCDERQKSTFSKESDDTPPSGYQNIANNRYDKKMESNNYEDKSGCGCLIAILLFFVALCYFTDENEVARRPIIYDKKIAADGNVALINKNNHPLLLDDVETAKEYYDGLGSLVTINKAGHISPGEKSDYVIFIGTEPADGKSIYVAEKFRINKITITPLQGKGRTNMSLAEGIKAAEGYLPWNLLEKYYRLERTNLHAYEAGNNKKFIYDIRYVLKDCFYYDNDEKKLPLNMSLQIVLNQEKFVEVIQIGKDNNIRLTEVSIYPDNPYTKLDWKPDNLHPLPIDKDRTMENWTLLNSQLPAKLLSSDKSVFDYAHRLGEENVYAFYRMGKQDTYGFKRKNQLVEMECFPRDDETYYLHNIKLNFTRIMEKRKVSLDEAVKLLRAYIPYNILDKHYTFLFSRKEIPSSNNAYQDVRYKVVYKRKPDLLEGNKKMEIPTHITISITENSGNIVDAGIDGFRYTAHTTSTYERAKDRYGYDIEIHYPGHTLGYYESGSELTTYEQWPNPF